MTESKLVAEEIDWLRYFMIEADFGPAHSEVVEFYMRRFEEKTGKRVPAEWREGYIFDDEEEVSEND